MELRFDNGVLAYEVEKVNVVYHEKSIAAYLTNIRMTAAWQDELRFNLYMDNLYFKKCGDAIVGVREAQVHPTYVPFTCSFTLGPHSSPRAWPVGLNIVHVLGEETRLDRVRTLLNLRNNGGLVASTLILWGDKSK
jgi:hypothetical protein